MNAAQIRSSFLSYFAKNGHQRVDSSALVPQNDPTLMFTNAGMVQFKDVFTGREKRDYKRATSSQKCVRAGGKHNDLENVGRTARHHTFFEMLGNFSFGDYFKEGAIDFAWSWLVDELKLDPKRLVITVFGGDAELPGIGADDEARALWKKRTGFGDERIIGMGKADNFWMMGDTGPQGPCSEIHYFMGDGAVDLGKFNQEPTPDGRGWMEIWNLVFMQFERKTKDAPLLPLPKPSIDTGAGLERVAAVVEGKTSNYDTSLLRPLVDFVAATTKKTYGASMAEDDVSMRVLADHARATAFLIGDGVTPSNEGRGYTLRRIMRRGIRHGVRIGLEPAGWSKLIEQVGIVMGDAYPELRERRATIDQFATAEDAAFRRTLDRGLKLLDDEVATIKKAGKKTISGDVVFKLYDTFGFPEDLTAVIAEERGLTADLEGAKVEMAKQKARSADFAGSGEQAVADLWKQVRGELGATQFLGYDKTDADGDITWLGKKEGALTSASVGEVVAIVAKQTPFYGEAGGQQGDAGTISNRGGESFILDVTDTIKPGGDLIVHQATVREGTVKRGAAAHFTVDVERRDAIRANHSATHLLHLALKDVLGEHVSQKGSLVAPDRLRFDFSHGSPVTDEQKQRIEDWVNLEVRANIDTHTDVKSFDDARKMGAVALFGEKYGSEVRVLRIGSRSMELCGGTHVRRTGDIGLFKITQELGIAQGVRRIEAVTGAGALGYVRQVEGELAKAAALGKTSPEGVVELIGRLQKDLKERERKIEELQKKMALGGGGAGGDLLSQAKDINGIKVLSARTPVSDPKALREVADQLRNQLGSGLVVLGGAEGDKVSLVAAVTPDLVGRLHAGKIIAEVASIVGGKGGGRPDLAQAGGSDASKLDDALAKVFSLVS